MSNMFLISTGFTVSCFLLGHQGCCCCFGQESESLGFHIKGGEKKKKKTEQWMVFHYTTPIFISHIIPGGVADRYVWIKIVREAVTRYRHFSPGGHVEFQENKKFCFCMASLALNSCLAEASMQKLSFLFP